MKNNKYNFPEEIYLEHLEEIGGVKFTPREIDIIAFMNSGRSAKKTASLLSLSPKTVENYSRNIMVKLKCNSKESVIDFIEKAGKFSFIKEYYLRLLAEKIFKKCLENIFSLKGRQEFILPFVYEEKKDNGSFFIYQRLIADLKLAGITLFSYIKKENQSFFNEVKNLKEDSFVIYSISKNFVETWQLEYGEEKEGSVFFQETTSFPTKKIFLFLEDLSFVQFLRESEKIDCICLEEQENYYYFVFEILKKVFPNINFESIIFEFDKEYSLLSGNFICHHNLADSQKSVIEKNAPFKFTLKIFPFINYKPVLFIIIISLLGLMLIIYTTLRESHKKEAILSELFIPSSVTFLNRPDLLRQIESEFNTQSEGIKTIVLVGVGGAGKTTLARQYARMQKTSFIWEINAETVESFLNSWESLAYALALSKEEINLLKSFQEINNAAKKIEKITLFIKDRLKNYFNWLLIYDNVENFKDIHHYFPYDNLNWGKGKVILTSRNSTLHTNSYLKNIIHIKEISDQEKQTLFLKINSEKDKSNFKKDQLQELEKFLSLIPSFPLDISLAANYINYYRLKPVVW